MDKCFIDALFANTDKKVKGEENQMKEKKINQQSIDRCRDYRIPGIWVCFILLHKSWKGIR